MNPTIIIRHKKENRKKCTLTFLEPRPDFQFITYPFENVPDLSSCYILTMGAPVLTKEENNLGICLIDATWLYAEKILKQIALHNPRLIYRSLPANTRTAYPRKQTKCPNPEEGLASIEALYATFSLQEKERDFLLENYHWKESFLEKNPHLRSTL
jgi:pre-rRNA-processing protein TSR3